MFFTVSRSTRYQIIYGSVPVRRPGVGIPCSNTQSKHMLVYAVPKLKIPSHLAEVLTSGKVRWRLIQSSDGL